MRRARYRKELYHSVYGTVETDGLRHLLNNTTYIKAAILFTAYIKMAAEERVILQDFLYHLNVNLIVLFVRCHVDSAQLSS